jgi:hypothetical protein
VRAPEPGHSTTVPPAVPSGRGQTFSLLVLTAVATAALGVAAASTPALVAVLLAGQVALAWAWTSMVGASAGSAVLGVGAALACDLTLVISDSDDIGGVVGVVGAALAAVIVQQLARRRSPVGAVSGPAGGTGSPGEAGRAAGVGGDGGDDSRVRVTVDMAASLSGVVFVALFAGYLSLRAESGPAADPWLVTGLIGAGAAVFASRLAGLVGLPAGAAALLGLLVGTGGGAICAAVADSLSAPDAVSVAAAAAAAAAVTALAFARAGSAVPIPPDRRATPGGMDGRDGPRALAGAVLAAVLPLVMAAPVVYLVGHQQLA